MSDRNREALMALKIKVVEKGMEHYNMDPHPVSPI